MKRKLLVQTANRLQGYEATIPEDYRGLERFAARKKIVADFEALGLLDEIKPHDLKVPLW